MPDKELGWKELADRLKENKAKARKSNGFYAIQMDEEGYDGLIALFYNLGSWEPCLNQKEYMRK